MFKSNAVCAVVVWLLMAASLLIVMPKSVSLLATLGAATANLCVALLMALADEFPRLPAVLRRGSTLLSRHRVGRNLYAGLFAATVFASTLASAAFFVNELPLYASVQAGPCHTAANATTPLAYHLEGNTCLLPQYHVFTWILAMIVLAAFLKLHYLVKTTLLVIMVAVYTTLMMTAFPALFNDIQVSNINLSLLYLVPYFRYDLHS